MTKGWKVSSSFPLEFSVKLTEGILSPRSGELVEYGSSSRRLVFVDCQVFRHFGEKIHLYFLSHQIEAKIISIDIAEESKDLDTLLFILNSIENFGLLRRSEPIIAIGGGVLLDIVGFAASTFRRSVPYIKVPTTLLSIVDASIGIKTSINHFGRRNRLGSYYAPQAAYLDTSFLKTLPRSEIHQALGEIIKMAVIKNGYLFGFLEKNLDFLLSTKFTEGDAAKEVIFLSIDGMIKELEPNLWEVNLERSVDFGHSFSPLLEMNSLSDNDVPTLSHGEAVALDIIFSSCLSVSRGLLDQSSLDRIIALCRQSSLPVYHPYFSDPLLLWESLLDTVRHRNNNQHLPIPPSIGEVCFLNDVTLEDVKSTSLLYSSCTQPPQ